MCPLHENRTRHPGLDPGSRFWIPASAGMTRIGTIFLVNAMNVVLLAFIFLLLLSTVSTADTSENMDQQLILASKLRDMTFLQNIIDKGANINAKDQDGTPALMLAAQKQSKDIVKLLLKNGADVNAKDKHGRTALERADWFGHYEIVEILGGKRADRDMAGYPDTPEGAVGAYAQAGFAVASVGQLGACNNVKEQKRYVLDYFDPGYDCIDVVSGFKVIKISEHVHEAEIEVIYDDIGGICLAAPEILMLGEKKEKSVIYDLKKHEGYWKIRAPLEPPRISVESAIELLKYSMLDGTELDEKIAELKRYLANRQIKGNSNE